ncbi:hypothetical protein B0T24DRAFT_379565 [Lasiosphaeria ovina]|uniref:Secreted protein n=1 Tax=Lasiosphaeria ovina TaxID=92902 RepID=A0AAE0JZV5_9PEZI|nr:hypothetical protein B0T24DRAFT_379565 [Lasiosphaeria ovina]
MGWIGSWSLCLASLGDSWLGLAAQSIQYKPQPCGASVCSPTCENCVFQLVAARRQLDQEVSLQLVRKIMQRQRS